MTLQWPGISVFRLRGICSGIVAVAQFVLAQPLPGQFSLNFASDELTQTLNEFCENLRTGNWDAALDLCTTRVQNRARIYPNTEAFFRDCVPIDELPMTNQFSGYSFSTNQFTGYNLNATDPSLKVQWTASLTSKDKKIAFDPVPLKELSQLDRPPPDGPLAPTNAESLVKITLEPIQRTLAFDGRVPVRMLITNLTDRAIRIDSQQVALNGSMDIFDDRGNKVPYVAGPHSTLGHYWSIASDETTALVENYDLASHYAFTRPGNYTVRFNGKGLMLWGKYSQDVKTENLKSNLINITLLPTPPSGEEGTASCMTLPRYNGKPLNWEIRNFGRRPGTKETVPLNLVCNLASQFWTENDQDTLVFSVALQPLRRFGVQTDSEIILWNFGIGSNPDSIWELANLAMADSADYVDSMYDGGARVLIIRDKSDVKVLAVWNFAGYEKPVKSWGNYAPLEQIGKALLSTPLLDLPNKPGAPYN